ncbi:hypothetical protein Patl1_14770 [Pistacia atlantica]|uniref:Uncharacterized protein n=1 Tax=Pistacia atlantica TaxID=434234 RepID=A0ACC1AXJ3_9ROSI|nr:hypothetical protein Patl1_14770 [Pistacia atlantica]
MMKDDQENDPDYDLKDDNEDDEDEDKVDKAFISAVTMNQVLLMLRDMSIAVLTIRTATITKDDWQNDLDYDLKDDNEDDKDEDEDEDKDDKGYYRHIDNESGAAHIERHVHSRLYLLSLKLFISTCFKLSIMARLPLSREEVNNLIATLLLRRNRQFIGHHLHPTTTEIRMDSHMLTLIVKQLLGRRFNAIEQLEIFELGAIVDSLTTNQMSCILKDMSIDALRELKGVSLDNDNINLDGGNNTQQNNPDDSNNEGQPAE